MKTSEITHTWVLDERSKRAGYKIKWLSVQYIESHLDSDQYVGPGGTNGIKNRYQNFGIYFNTHEEIEVPLISIIGDKVIFENGRHRYAYLRDSGMTFIPFGIMS